MVLFYLSSPNYYYSTRTPGIPLFFIRFEVNNYPCTTTIQHNHHYYYSYCKWKWYICGVVSVLLETMIFTYLKLISYMVVVPIAG